MNQKLAFVFPGQGSQKIGMLSEMAAEHSLIEQTFSLASSVLDYDLWSLVQTGEQDAINKTEVTQPLLLTASTALWQVWKDLDGDMPALLAGHSLGEWSALVAADVVDFGAAVKLVQLRGRYMQEAVPAGVGGMAAIVGLEDKAVEDICAEVAGDEFVGAVNYNSPGQIVIAGHKSAVDRAAAACKEAGAKRALPLPVSAPFHTPLMAPAAERLAKDMDEIEFRSPGTPILHNVGVEQVENGDEIRRRMMKQITAPVPWVKTIGTMAGMGIEKAVECGPGKVLAGLNKRITDKFTTLNIDNSASLSAALNEGES
jgi:[acyl-carrier-protein] S-malonyltransferase